MSEKVIKPRRAPRVAIQGRAESMFSPLIKASLIDLSLTGAGLEHPLLVRPGSRCELIIRMEQRELRLKAQVIWSAVKQSEKRPDGETELIYRTGVEFLDLTPEHQEQLTMLVQVFQTGGGAASSGWKVFYCLFIA